MKVALITDTHAGVRGDSEVLLDHQKKFYDEIFFPTLVESKIDRVVHCGDVYDRRKYINFNTLKRTREDFLLPLAAGRYDVDIIVGNHDTFSKTSNIINSVHLLSSDFDFNVFTGPCNRTLQDGTSIAYVPWINRENEELTYEFIEHTKAQILFGHLELQGFEMYRGTVANHGMIAGVLKKFDVVCSGHFHTKSSKENIHYLGAPFEMTWADYNDPKGFHIFDTVTRSLEFIRNPNSLFKVFDYDDSNGLSIESIKTIDFSEFARSYVKVNVIKKNNPYLFDLFIEELEKADPVDVKTTDIQTINQHIDDMDFDGVEDTHSLIRRFCANVESDTARQDLESLLIDVHQEALNKEV
jgi:DNA repair exonuclease SbcCD nuclease subunit